MVLSRPETDYAPVTIPALGPSMGEDLPGRLLCPVRALRYYLKLKHKGQDPNNRFRRLLCAFKLGHTGVRVDQATDQTGLLGGSGWGHPSPNPHQFPSKRAPSICLFLGVPPELFPETGHGSGLLEKQQHVCFVLSERPLPNGGCDYGGPFRGWSASHILMTIDGNRATCRCWLLSHCFHCPEPGDTVSNGTLWEIGKYSPKY